jgi:hypothetical protein
MKVSTVLSVAFAMSGCAQAENTRGGNIRKLAQINEDGLSKRQQRKKEMAAETESTAQPEEMITLDALDVTIIEHASEEKVVVTIEEVDDAGDVVEELSMTFDVPSPPSIHNPKGPHGKQKPLEAEPEAPSKGDFETPKEEPEPTPKGEPEPTPKGEPEAVTESGGKHHGKGKGKHGGTKDIKREGKPGSLTEGHKKNHGAKGPKK